MPFLQSDTTNAPSSHLHFRPCTRLGVHIRRRGPCHPRFRRANRTKPSSLKPHSMPQRQRLAWQRISRHGEEQFERQVYSTCRCLFVCSFVCFLNPCCLAGGQNGAKMIPTVQLLLLQPDRGQTRRKKKSCRVFVFFFNADTSHHCELYHQNIILHSFEAF